MQKAEIYDYLDQRGVWHEITEHPAVYDMAEMAAVDLPYPGSDARISSSGDDKRRGYYLITVRGDKRVDLKTFRRQRQTRPLTFASPEELGMLLGLLPGSVSPLGLLNDGERRVQFCLDRTFLEPPGLIGVHPNENTATVWLKTEDLIGLLQDHGTSVQLVDL